MKTHLETLLRVVKRPLVFLVFFIFTEIWTTNWKIRSNNTTYDYKTVSISLNSHSSLSAIKSILWLLHKLIAIQKKYHFLLAHFSNEIHHRSTFFGIPIAHVLFGFVYDKSLSYMVSVWADRLNYYWKLSVTSTCRSCILSAQLQLTQSHPEHPRRWWHLHYDPQRSWHNIYILPRPPPVHLRSLTLCRNRQGLSDPTVSGQLPSQKQFVELGYNKWVQNATLYTGKTQIRHLCGVSNGAWCFGILFGITTIITPETFQREVPPPPPLISSFITKGVD